VNPSRQPARLAAAGSARDWSLERGPAGAVDVVHRSVGRLGDLGGARLAARRISGQIHPRLPGTDRVDEPLEDPEAVGVEVRRDDLEVELVPVQPELGEPARDVGRALAAKDPGVIGPLRLRLLHGLFRQPVAREAVDSVEGAVIVAGAAFALDRPQ
jgi:hypothetical protein